MELTRVFRSWPMLATIVFVVSLIATSCGRPPGMPDPTTGPQPRAQTPAADLVATATTAINSLQTTQTAVVAGTTAVADPATPTPDDAANADLHESILSVLDGLNGEFGIGVENLATGETFAMNAQRQYPAASLYKLVLLAEAYRRIADGSLALSQMTVMQEADYSDSLMWDEELKIGERVSVKGLLRVMVIQSSNAAAHAIERLTGLRSINDSAQRIGLNETHMPTAEIRARYDDWRSEMTATSVPDLMRYFGMLYRGQLVSPEASKEMLDLLKQQQINDRIPALLPRDVAVAHKTGNLPGVIADAGIIFGQQSDTTLVVLTDGADHDQATEAIGEIARLVYQWRNR